MAAIALGVGALVAVHSFRADVERSIRMESRSLLGADLRFERNQPYEEPVLSVVDSLEAAGATVSRVTTFMSMAYAPESDLSRLVQIRAVEGGYPLYGDVRTDPPGVWTPGAHASVSGESAGGGEESEPDDDVEPAGSIPPDGGIQPGHAVVDPAVLIQLDVEAGDTLRIGEADFVVAGSVVGLPTDLGFQTAVGPRVLIADESLAETGLLTFGSLARYQIFFRFDDRETGWAVQERYEDELRAQLVDSDTAEELAGDLTEGLEVLSRFLGLVGLVALLLGGVGVASAIHVYVKERLDAVAVLRCIGATEGDVFQAYLLQTGALGLLGAGVGVILGIGAQLLLPTVLGGILPVTVEPTFHPAPVMAGLVAGVWIAGIFALIPLLGLRKATPLQALRRDFEEEGEEEGIPGGGWGASATAASSRGALGRGRRVLLRGAAFLRRDPLRSGAYGALAGSVLAVSVWQAPSTEVGLGFAASLAASLTLLFFCARGLIWAVRRFFPRGADYPVRHGISNLFRPRNQTVTVVLALGFGAFLVAAVGQVRASILEEFSVSREGERPNLLLFDIQADQEAVVDSLLRAEGARDVSLTPVVPARLSAVKGESVDELLSRDRDGRPSRWVLSRLYRNTFRDHLTDSEELVAGTWWGDGEADGGVGGPGDGRDGGGGSAVNERGSAPPSGPGEPYRISIASDVAEDLDVAVGDRLTWDLQGVRVESVITSIRRVDWAQLQPNFFVVFEPGAIDDAPRTSVALARIPDEEARVRLQTTLVRRLPNVSLLDLEQVQATLARILDRASDAVRFLAGFSMVAGLLVLGGALATSRFQRLREGALLRTLGARRGQLLRVVVTEYLSLGAVAGAAGALLGAVGGWLAVRYVFEIGFRLDPLPLLLIWIGLTALTAAIGALASRGVLKNPPLVVLRRIAE